jgi:hypothetical protein
MRRVREVRVLCDVVVGKCVITLPPRSLYKVGLWLCYIFRLLILTRRVHHVPGRDRVCINTQPLFATNSPIPPAHLNTIHLRTTSSSLQWPAQSKLPASLLVVCGAYYPCLWTSSHCIPCTGKAPRKQLAAKSSAARKTAVSRANFCVVSMLMVLYRLQPVV